MLQKEHCATYRKSSSEVAHPFCLSPLRKTMATILYRNLNKKVANERRQHGLPPKLCCFLRKTIHLWCKVNLLFDIEECFLRLWVKGKLLLKGISLCHQSVRNTFSHIYVNVQLELRQVSLTTDLVRIWNLPAERIGLDGAFTSNNFRAGSRRFDMVLQSRGQRRQDWTQPCLGITA